MMRSMGRGDGLPEAAPARSAPALLGTIMRFVGTLKVWNAERGHGLVDPENGGQPVFVHISAFPTDAAPPTQDEWLSFEIVTGRDGRKQAVKVQRSRRVVNQAWAAPAPPRRVQRQRPAWGLALSLALAASAGLLGWMQLSQPQEPERLAQLAPVAVKAPAAKKH